MALFDAKARDKRSTVQHRTLEFIDISIGKWVISRHRYGVHEVEQDIRQGCGTPDEMDFEALEDVQARRLLGYDVT